MANVESDKPMLRGLTPPVLPPAGPSGAGAGQESEAAAADDSQRARLQQALTEQHRNEGAVAIPEFELDAPGERGSTPQPVQHLDSERTPVLTLEQAAALSQERTLAREQPHAAPVTAPEAQSVQAPVASAPPAPYPPASLSEGLSNEDKTIITPTPIPPEADDYTHPTTDAQILETARAGVNPAVPLRAASLGMAAMLDRQPRGRFGKRFREAASRAFPLSVLQMALLVLGAASAGAVLMKVLTPAPKAAETVQSIPSTPASAGRPVVTHQPSPAAGAGTAQAVTAPPADEVNKPLARKKRAPKKLARARLPNANKATR